MTENYLSFGGRRSNDSSIEAELHQESMDVIPIRTEGGVSYEFHTPTKVSQLPESRHGHKSHIKMKLESFDNIEQLALDFLELVAMQCEVRSIVDVRGELLEAEVDALLRESESMANKPTSEQINELVEVVKIKDWNAYRILSVAITSQLYGAIVDKQKLMQDLQDEMGNFMTPNWLKLCNLVVKGDFVQLDELGAK